MAEFIQLNPQVLIFGKIIGIKDFDAQSFYIKYQIRTGSQWLLQSGKTNAESFQTDLSLFQDERIAFIDQTFEICYLTHSIRGWPKIIIEIWQVDSDGRHSLAGYTLYSFPFKAGKYNIELGCWRPRSINQDEKLLNTIPELIHRDILMSSDSRFGFYTQTQGNIILEFNIILKDFQYQGVQFNI